MGLHKALKPKSIFIRYLIIDFSLYCRTFGHIYVSCYVKDAVKTFNVYMSINENAVQESINIL